jgi:translation initiation factor IF-2
VERGPDPARVPGPGRTSRAHARRDPPRPRGGNPRGRIGRAGQDRPGHPRRAGPLAGCGVGQPAGRRGLAHGRIAPRGQPGAGQGGRVHRPGRDADPGGPGRGPPGHPGAARRRGAAARPAGLAGRPVPGGWRRRDQPDRHRAAAPAVRAGHPRRLPDGAGRADQRPQARTGPAGDARPRLRARPGHGQRGQPAAAGRPHGAARGNRRRRRPDRTERARRAGRRHARGGAGRRHLAQ